MPYRSAPPADFRDAPQRISAPLLPASAPSVTQPSPKDRREARDLSQLAEALATVRDPSGPPTPLQIALVRTQPGYAGDVFFPWLALPQAPLQFSLVLIEEESVGTRGLRLIGTRLRTAWRAHFEGLERSRIIYRGFRLDRDPEQQAALAQHQHTRCPRCDVLSYHRTEFHEYKAGGLTWRLYTERCDACAYSRMREEGVCPQCRNRLWPNLQASRSTATLLQSDEDGIVRREAKVWQCLGCSYAWQEARTIAHPTRDD
jgi:hypothetical protein